QKLPYRKMLITTGVLIGVVLMVMVGEQAQEMQLAHWISTTPIASLVPMIPRRMGMWFAGFTTYETRIEQMIAAVIVIGSYDAEGHFGGKPAIEEPVQEAKAEARVAITEELQPVR